MKELPRYKSHKIVHALKIHSIDYADDPRDGAVITPVDGDYGPFAIDGAYVTKHAPVAGGYYVVYQDGYLSWSPEEAFEEGYTLDDDTSDPDAFSTITAAIGCVRDRRTTARENDDQGMVEHLNDLLASLRDIRQTFCHQDKASPPADQSGSWTVPLDKSQYDVVAGSLKASKVAEQIVSGVLLRLASDLAVQEESAWAQMYEIAGVDRKTHTLCLRHVTRELEVRRTDDGEDRG